MDLRDWKTDELPDDFADRVMARIDHEQTKPPRRLLRRAALGVGLAAAAAALFLGLRSAAPPSKGGASASVREQVSLGSRAIAVLEPGARVTWQGDDVDQLHGDVFYRVEPGGAFRVHTPAGEVQVLGTCFRVQVNDEEVSVNGRDVKSGFIGAALGVAALVSVYEGRVAVSRASDTVTLSAGEKARADARGVHREPGDAASTAGGEGSGGDVRPDDPLLAANANLADSVRDYRRKLETIEAQKRGVEKQLADAQARLEAAAKDGKSGPPRYEYDLSEDDWKTLAKDGTVRARYPCLRPKPNKDEITPADLQKAGLAPDDGVTVEKAMAASRARLWATIRPLCVTAMGGDAAIAEKLGPSTCESLVRDVAAANGTDVAEEMRHVSEIRAGLRPMPADGGGPVVKMMLALTGETKAVEKDLMQSLGPDEAHRLVYSEDGVGCWNNSTWGVGPRPAASPK